MAAEHYFTSDPESELRLKTISVHLGGRDLELTTANGIFSPGRLDEGTAVLLDKAPPPPPSGDFLDIGCGWGPISYSLALASPDATIWAVDVNDRALDLVRRNAQKLGLSNINAVRPEDVPEALSFTAIWSNPPIRVGKAVLHELMLGWLPRLEAGADAWLVVQRNLGSDSLHTWLQKELPEDFSVDRAATAKGYRVLRVHRGTAGNADASSD